MMTVADEPNENAGYEICEGAIENEKRLGASKSGIKR